MNHGYNGKIAKIDLSSGSITIEEPADSFYRKYFGGWSFVAYYLLKETEAKLDPFDPGNLLIFASGVVTGAPLAGSGRSSVGAKSPLTGGFGESDVGGFWGVELKRAGFDALVIKGRAEGWVYLFVHDGKIEIKNASHLLGKATAESQELIKGELGNKAVRISQIGLAGEKLVRYACIVNDLVYIAGRTGMGAVMGSKNLKAIAVKGSYKISIADPEAIKEISNWLRSNWKSFMSPLSKIGTGSGMPTYNEMGGLPTSNFSEGFFSKMDQISPYTIKDTIRIGMKTCYACPVSCRRVVQIETPYVVNPIYGGPQYETLAALGSNCGIGDLEIVAKAHELCNAYGLDTVSTGDTAAFAMECFEKGILTTKETNGIEFIFGNGQGLLKMIEMIAKRQGIGDLLAEGVRRAAQKIGKGAEKFALHVKNQEIPMHDPRIKHGLALGYAFSPTGADHDHVFHDLDFIRGSTGSEKIKALGILDPISPYDFAPEKIRAILYHTNWLVLGNCLAMCHFLLSLAYNYVQVQDIVNGVTGWNTTVWELMKVGERAVNIAQCFNVREGFSRKDNKLPERFFMPSTPSRASIPLDKEKFDEAMTLYCLMRGWDPISTMPSVGKLYELGIDWVLLAK